MKHISAGMAIFCQNRILLVRQKNDSKGHHLSIPKGCIEKYEQPIDAAIRETYEETGLIIERSQINPKPFLMNIETTKFQRRIIYFIARIEKPENIKPIDLLEIADAKFYSYEEAEKCLQITQLSVLMHLNPYKLPTRASEWLCQHKYITKEEHYETDMLIYNYTRKCKEDSLWDEITLWCRGLITDTENNIKYRPIKKFFEESQMFSQFKPEDINNFTLYEKKDGALGVLYWLDNLPYMATRGSFCSLQAINGTRILYTKYSNVLTKLNPAYTYFFEIIYPKDRHIVDYGNIEDVFLIGAYDNINMKDILLDELTDVKIAKVKQINQHGTWEELQKTDNINEEGYVAFYKDGTRIKIKFPTYKKKHEFLWH